MNNETCSMTDQQKLDFHRACLFRKCISWTAITVGALVGIGLSYLLSLFNIAIGLSIVATTKSGAISLAIGGFLGLLVGTIVAMFVAGFAAGYLGRSYCMKRNLGVLYGFTTWCLALILTMLLTSHWGPYVTSYTNVVTSPTSIVATSDNATTVAAKKVVESVSSESASNSPGSNMFLIFVVFFVGALASSFGGYFGMSCRTCGVRCCCPANKENE